MTDAIAGMTLAIARDLSSIGVRANAIAPGVAEAPFSASPPPEIIEALGNSVLYRKRLGKPQEIARLAVCMIENDCINGERVRIDGGVRMQTCGAGVTLWDR